MEMGQDHETSRQNALDSDRLNPEEEILTRFHFDDTVSFHRNVEKFLAELEVEDVEMGKIFRDSFAELLAAVEGDGDPKSARAAFNAAVVAALGALDGGESV